MIQLLQINITHASVCKNITHIKRNYCNICVFKIRAKQNYLNNGSIIVCLLSMELNKRAAPRAFSIVALMVTQLVDAIQE